MDESGHFEDPVASFVGMGGIVAEKDSWVSFDLAWKAALQEFIGGAPFHMKDFVRYPFAGLYEGWKEEKRREFLSRLVRSILDSGCRFVGSVVSIRDFNELPVACKNSLLDPYYLAFQTVTRGMALIAEGGLLCPPEPVALMYSQQEEFGATELGRAQQLWLAQQKDSEYGKWVGPYSFDNPERVCGLQAADLFAYELTREYEHFFESKRRPMRWAMKQFVKKAGLELMVKFFCRETMLVNLLENGPLCDQQLEQFNNKLNSILYLRANQ